MSIHTTRPGTDRGPSPVAGQDGQALIELMLIVVLCIIIGFGIYEGGILFHNISVMNRGISRAASYAAHGASMEHINRSVTHEAKNLMGSAWIAQRADTEGIKVQIVNTENDTLIGPTQYSDLFEPGKQLVTSYLFWAQGYEVRVSLGYRIAWNLPYIRTFYVPLRITGSQAILAPNDIDRDGLVDHREQAYVEYALAEDYPTGYSNGDTVWIHPVHRDGYDTLDTDPDADVDGDSLTTNDTFPYDFDNDAVEDKYDPGDNQMEYNPRLGPTGWKHMP